MLGLLALHGVLALVLAGFHNGLLGHQFVIIPLGLLGGIVRQLHVVMGFDLHDLRLQEADLLNGRLLNRLAVPGDGDGLAVELGDHHAVIRNVGNERTEGDGHQQERLELLHHAEVQQHDHHSPHGAHLPSELVDAHAADEALEGAE